MTKKSPARPIRRATAASTSSHYLCLVQLASGATYTGHRFNAIISTVVLGWK